MLKTLFGVIVVVAVLAAGAGGLYVIGEKSLEKMPVTVAPTKQVTPSGQTGQREDTNQSSNKVVNITVEGFNFYFKPDKITINKNEPVNLTFSNKGTVPHNFTLTNLGIFSKTISPGESETIFFTPNKSGSFTYFCSVDSHRERGMEGTLIVL